LLLPNAQFAHECIGVNFLFETLHEFRGCCFFSSFLSIVPRHLFARQVDIVSDAKIWAEIEFLEDNPDSLA
jgi:hypothetical protein